MKYYSIAYVAKALGLTRASVWHRIQVGSLKAVNVNEGVDGPARWIISQAELDRSLLIQKLERNEPQEEIN